MALKSHSLPAFESSRWVQQLLKKLGSSSPRERDNSGRRTNFINFWHSLLNVSIVGLKSGHSRIGRPSPDTKSKPSLNSNTELGWSL